MGVPDSVLLLSTSLALYISQLKVYIFSSYSTSCYFSTAIAPHEGGIPSFRQYRRMSKVAESAYTIASMLHPWLAQAQGDQANEVAVLIELHKAWADALMVSILRLGT